MLFAQEVTTTNTGAAALWTVALLQLANMIISFLREQRSADRAERAAVTQAVIVQKVGQVEHNTNSLATAAIKAAGAEGVARGKEEEKVRAAGAKGGEPA